jgi:hypothetical protein
VIAMSFLAMMTTGFDGVEAVYEPARPNDLGRTTQAFVRVKLNGVSAARASMTLTVEDARTLAEALPQILMLHDAAERLAAEKAVA